ncbi:ribonuclease HII [Yeosuana marina]|uniref:ribonuclease HII n=1 Tax=Yeosuana marina TaxID=1565536 RepID=UPI0030EB5223|tara:strand:+ start:3316 stop:5754 length:2439 start_codon:yes stop_codon:yes gene_type:complete
MRLFCFSLLFLFIYGCSNEKTNHTQLIHFVPVNSSIVLKTSNLESLKSSIQNNDFLQHFSKTNAYKNLESKLNGLPLLQPTGELLICFSKNAIDSLQYAIITKYSKGLFVRDSLKNYIEETLKYKKKSIIKSSYNNHTFYSAVIDSTFFASSSIKLVENAFNYSNTNAELEKIYRTTETDKTVSVILKCDETNFIKSFFPDNQLPLKTFTNYLAFDTEISQDETLINGITQANDSTESFINVFKNTIPQENQIQHITPIDADGFLSFTFNTYEKFHSNLVKFTQIDTLKETSHLFDNIIEVGVIYNSNDRAIVLNSLDGISTEDALISEQNVIDTFRQVDILSFSKPDLFETCFSPLISFNKATKYCILDNFLVFGDNLEILHDIISNYQNKTTLSEQPYFNDIQEQLSDASSLLMVFNPSILNDILNNNLEDDSAVTSLDNYKISALQFIYDTNFAHVNGIIKKTKVKAAQNSITEELNIRLDNDLLNTPQFVTNHITRQKEIVVQDIKNNLYLISNTGKVLWKKQLDGAILGQIEQIDLYKNGKLQLAFTTPHRLYVIDRNGHNVSPFPGKFNDVITQPLSVFDYGNNKNYRLLITQGKNLLMYDKTLKVVKGFVFKSANNPILNQPQHFRIGSKDYIVFKTQNKMYILDRTGRTRVSPKTSNSFSNESIYLYNNKFTTTNPDGELITIDSRGNSVSQNLNLSSQHHIETSSKTLVTLSENKLTIKGITYELDYGIYTSPKLFYLQDKIYVAITDLQTQKVYLFDSNAQLLPNFPVYGNSAITLDNIDSDKDLEFVTKGGTNSVILYQIN